MRTTTHWIGTLVLRTMLVCLARQAQSTESDPTHAAFYSEAKEPP
jgi:hypothetical protein